MTPFQIEKSSKPRPGTTSLRGSIREGLAAVAMNKIHKQQKEYSKLRYLIIQNYTINITDKIYFN